MRVAILGARGIGRVHARIFHELGADVCAVLGSSEESAARAAEALRSSYGIDAEPFADVERLFERPLDAVSICTPPRLHFVHLMAAFGRRLPAFCEKPLLWDDDATSGGVLRQLDAVMAHPDRRLFVNTSNAAFIDALRERLSDAANTKRFYFRLSTNGPYRGRDIAVDLMPHALSLLIRFTGRQVLSAFAFESAETRYLCRFSYGGCEVDLDLQEGTGARELVFRVDEREFRRIQEGDGSTYRVFIEDSRNGDRVHVEDPFRIWIADFLRHVALPSPNDHAAEAAENLRLMTQVLAPMETN